MLSCEGLIKVVLPQEEAIDSLNTLLKQNSRTVAL